MDPSMLLFGWWFIPLELVVLVSEYCCSSYGVAIPFSSFIPPQTLLLWSLGSGQWLSMHVCICIIQMLAESLRGQL